MTETVRAEAGVKANNSMMQAFIYIIMYDASLHIYIIMIPCIVKDPFKKKVLLKINFAKD